MQLTAAHADVILKAANGGKLTRREKKLFEEFRRYQPTAAENRAERISFAYGNAAIGNPSVTRELVERVATELDAERERKVVPIRRQKTAHQ